MPPFRDWLAVVFTARWRCVAMQPGLWCLQSVIGGFLDPVAESSLRRTPASNGDGGHEEGKTPEAFFGLTWQMAGLGKTFWVEPCQASISQHGRSYLEWIPELSPRGHLSMSNLESPEQPRKQPFLPYQIDNLRQ
ncbi:hypothetical protein F5144DRAFT_74876 [Chaetomium tenue]|uniref:Uncharacterized protein n=1 Tax=Chaetomium tenue TaxID=1854479 RepID=A0ACB7PSY1_9PEZI|nr:hypothetical protein F5144DRAFT_74876 [Chaetomium globosum]